ncbi:glycosyltransferase family 4 protein [Bacillus sp. FJAT-22090]|uniref:glycosyltransferase family 4 protein n=1 Tax=Bacillus sp. FJAT-22090 TaxID=1581038 RepID=UPI0011A1F5F7|nr:glycosyltransferase family 4 protein [Bacillus sp. FJAT-22090]
MNIWIFNHYASGANSSGGTRHFDLAKQLVKMGHSVTIYASSFNHQLLVEEHLVGSKSIHKESISEGVKFVWIKTTPYYKNNFKRVFNMLSYTKRAYTIARKESSRPDIVIGSLVHPLAAYIGYLIAKKYNSIFYFEERDLWPQTLIDLGKMSPRNPVIYILSKIELFLFRKANRIIFLFDKAVNYGESKGISREKFLYIPNGFDMDRTFNSIELSTEIKQVLKNLEQQMIAIYTGAHGKANNLDVILNTASQIMKKETQIHFVLIGDGPEKERLVKRIKREKITNVTMLPPVKKEMIPEILKYADVGLLPLVNSPVFKWGISPNKLFDYMGASLPVVILCDVEGTPVELASGGQVIRGNFEEELVNFLTHIDKSELVRLGNNSRNYVEKNHSWERLATKLEAQMISDVNKFNKNNLIKSDLFEKNI